MQNKLIYTKEVFFLNIIFFIYVFGVILKKVIGFSDGLIDVVVILTMIFFLLLRLSKTLYAIKRLFRKRIFFVFLLFVIYYIYLATTSYNQVYLIILEFVSVLKWMIYFFLGYLYSFVYIKNDLKFPNINAITVFSTFVLLFSLATYNWSGLSGPSNLFGFYENSFESIFSIRSVFAVFGFVLFLYAVENIQKSKLFAWYLLFSSLVFIFMSGNRKTIIAMAIVILFMRMYGKYKVILKFLKSLLLIFGLLIITQTAIFQKSTEEYSNVKQPRIFAYIMSSRIAYDYFPFGSGPATAFSKGSMVNYSPIYYKYGIDKKWGFGPDDKIKFYNDTYWAQIIAQYGVIGSILILVMYFIIMAMISKSNEKRISYILIMLIFLFLSITTPILQRIEVALFIFFVIGIKVQQLEKETKE